MKSLCCVITLMALAGCSSGPKLDAVQQQKFDMLNVVVEDSPSWFKNPPSEDGRLIGTATATSSDLQLAIDKASLQARRQVAEKIAGKLSLKTSDHLRETNSVSTNFQRTIQETAFETSMAGYVVKEQKVAVSGNGYRAWVLVSSPTVQLASATSSPKEEFESQKAYQDLESEIKRSKRSDEPPLPKSAPRQKVTVETSDE